MGGQQHARTLLMNLLHFCFFDELPHTVLAPGAVDPRRTPIEFDCIMVDFMQYVAARVVGSNDEAFNVEQVARRVDEVADFFMNHANDPKRPVFRRMLVAMLDTVHNVPKNKSGTQRARDGEEGGHMDEALYEAALKEKEGGPLFDSLFVTNNPTGHRYRITGKKLWRSNNLKMQLWRLLTYRLMHAKVRAGSVLMIDEGIAISLSEYQQRREHIINKYCKQGSSPPSKFVQECVVTERLIHSKRYMKRFMVWPDGRYLPFVSTGIGEADIKIQAYMRRDNGFKRYLVVNQDTDIIFILLLHMQTFLYHDERDDEVEVWLDTRCPSDKQESRPYRYIDIKRLFQSLCRLFADEYPHVVNPVATFCFLVFSLETDFTRKFAPCLKITPALVWNTFSELHHYDVMCKDFIKYSQSTTGGSDQTVRCSQRTLPVELYGLLNDAVQYDCINKRYFFRHDKIKNFFYLLCQLRIMVVRNDIGLTGCGDGGGRANPIIVPVIEPEELLIYANEINERLDYYKKHALKQSTLDTHLVQLKRQMDATDPVMQATLLPPKLQSSRGLKARKVVEGCGDASGSSNNTTKQPISKFTLGVGGWMTPNKKYLEQKQNDNGNVMQEINQVLEDAAQRQREDDDVMEVEERRRIQRISDTVSGMMSSAASSLRGSGTAAPELTPGYVRQYEKKLSMYSNAAAPQDTIGSHHLAYFGVPIANDMLARCYRIEWYMAYCTDGWRHPGPWGALNCVATARHDKALSEWGWRAVELTSVEDLKQAMNSSYYVTECVKRKKIGPVVVDVKQQKEPRVPGEPILRWLAIEETNTVSHRRVYR